MKPEMIINFTPDGTGHCLYSELIDLQALGTLECRRASHIEFDEADQEWRVLTADKKETLFRSASRLECLTWERDNLEPP